MSIPLIPWENHVFPNEIQTELRRRSKNRGFNPVVAAQVSWQHNKDNGGDWESYRGPMTSWVRVCSNGYGFENKNSALDMPGFVLYGGKDFYTTYGFNRSVISSPTPFIPNQTVLGYTPDGRAHIIENDVFNSDYPIHVPSPEIEKISATIQKEILRRIRIEWTCFSFKQLEYMTPYFLVPGISMIVEWGWNHFNPLSLLNLENLDELAKVYNNPYPLYTDNILQSKGNYDVLFGIVTNFEWSVDGNKIRCSTEVTSKDRIWAGQIINANMVENEKVDSNVSSESKAETIQVIDSLKKFIISYIELFYGFIDQTNPNADSILENFLSASDEKKQLKSFIQYVKQVHPNNYKEYLFGLFYGRDEKNVKLDRPVEGDFDYKEPRTNLWMNMGLVIELVNFFSSQLKGVKDQPAFRIDIDDCVISAHPNLISSNSDILLIPNAKAPKYFSGIMGSVPVEGDEYKVKMTPCSTTVPSPRSKDLKKETNEINIKWANYRLKQILLPLNPNVIQRDDLNDIINFNRRQYVQTSVPFEFPFNTTYSVSEGGSIRTYEAHYTGLFKNLYLNVNQLKEIVQDASIITYQQVIEELFRRINSAASDCWNLKLVGSTGRFNTVGLATMKVVDEKMGHYTSNIGDIFTFDYFAADGLIQSINFRPMLSNAQAIRTIYAQGNVNTDKAVALSGVNELLDYKFKDRLSLTNDQTFNTVKKEVFLNSSFRTTLQQVQSLKPLKKACQMTLKNRDGVLTIFRLAIPQEHSEILNLILDDNDKERNPRYCGIMPNIQAEFTIQGIAGIRTFSMFRVRGLPEPYSENNIVFRVINVNDSLQNGQWTTTVIAGILPLRSYFCSKLGLSPKIVDKKS